MSHKSSTAARGKKARKKKFNNRYKSEKVNVTQSNQVGHILMIPWKWLYLKFTHQTQHQDGEVLDSQGLLVVTFIFFQARSARSDADVVTNFHGAYNSVFSLLPPHHTRMRCTQSFSCVQLFVTPWTAACQASLSKGFFQARILEWVVISSSRRSS